MKDAIFWSLFLLLSILTGCDSLEHWYPQDNVVEEIAEEIIDHEIGINIDLSPYSREKVPV